jgi:hypothetical protein
MRQENGETLWAVPLLSHRWRRHPFSFRVATALVFLRPFRRWMPWRRRTVPPTASQSTAANKMVLGARVARVGASPTGPLGLRWVRLAFARGNGGGPKAGLHRDDSRASCPEVGVAAASVWSVGLDADGVVVGDLDADPRLVGGVGGCGCGS